MDLQSLFDDGDEHVGRDRSPDLRLHGILGCAIELLDPQMLFDPFAEEFDLPTTAIQLGDRQCGQGEIVRQEDQSLEGSIPRGKLGCLLGALVCSLILVSGCASTQDSNYAAACAGIQATLDDTLAAMQRGASVVEVASLLFTDDVVIAVPGTKEEPGVTFHGMKPFMPTLAEWITEPIISWTIEEPFKVSGDLAVAYIIGKLGPTYVEPNACYRALWVFDKGHERLASQPGSPGR